MRKSPQESATIFKLNTIKDGLDGFDYYVLKDKNNRKRWVKKGCLFIIYKLTDSKQINIWDAIDKKNIKYPDKKFPNDWRFVGSGTTVPIQLLDDDSVKYPNEEQFMGHPKYTSKMKEILKKFLTKLKKKKIIKHYKIVTDTGLRKYMKEANKKSFNWF